MRVVSVGVRGPRGMPPVVVSHCLLSFVISALCCFPVLVSSALYFHPVYYNTIGSGGSGANVTQVVLPGFRMQSPTFRQGNVSFNVTAPLVAWFQSKSHSAWDSCELTNSPQEHQRVKGKLLYVSLPIPICPRETFIQQCQQFFCAGVIVFSDEDPAGLITWSVFEGGVDQRSLVAPLVELRYVCFLYALSLSVCISKSLLWMRLYFSLTQAIPIPKSWQP